MKIKLIKTGIITSMCLASGFLFSANAVDASAPIGEIRTTKMDNCINNYLKKGYIKVDGLKYYNNNTAMTDDDVMVQLLRTKDMHEHTNKVDTFNANSYTIGDTHSFDKTTYESESKIWGSYFSASGGVSAGVSWIFEVEINISLTYGKDVTSSISSNQTRGVGFDVYIDSVGTYSLYQNVTGYDYVMLGFNVSNRYRSELIKDKNGNVTGSRDVFDYSEWNLGEIKEFSSNVDEYFYAKKD